MLSFSLQIHKQLIINVVLPFHLLFNACVVLIPIKYYEKLLSCFDFLGEAEFPTNQLVKNLLQIKLQLESRYSLNHPTLYLSITYNCDSKLNCLVHPEECLSLPVCHLAACWEYLMNLQRRVYGESNGDSLTFLVVPSIYETA